MSKIKVKIPNTLSQQARHNELNEDSSPLYIFAKHTRDCYVLAIEKRKKLSTKMVKEKTSEYNPIIYN